METTVVQTSSSQSSQPINQHQSAVIQLHAVHHQTLTTTTSNNSLLRASYNQRAAVITGIMQISCGSLLVVFGIIAFSVGSNYKSGWNIWGGICFYGLTGILGLISKNRNRRMIVSYMVLSIISAICAGGQIIYNSIAAAVPSSCTDTYIYHDYHTSAGLCYVNTTAIDIHILAAVVGFVEMIVATVASAYCCGGTCNESSSQTVIHYAQPYPGGHVTVLTPGSYAHGSAIINPSQAYGMPAPYPPPQYSGQPMGHIDSPVGQTMSPHTAHMVSGAPSGGGSGPCDTRISTDTVYSYPLHSPPAYSYTPPGSTYPVPLDPILRPDSAFK